MSRDPNDVLREQGEEGKHSLPDAPVIHVLTPEQRTRKAIDDAARVPELEQRIAELERGLSFYADTGNWIGTTLVLPDENLSWVDGSCYAASVLKREVGG